MIEYVETMEAFLRDLKDLLDKHKATIVRSASINHELVVCINVEQNSMHKNIEATFDEEIGATDIKNKWYQVEQKIY